MIEQPGLNAVVIGTATSVHSNETIQAMQKNLHVLHDKPLSMGISFLCHPFTHYNNTLAVSNLASNNDSANKSLKRPVGQGWSGVLSSSAARFATNIILRDSSSHAAWSGGIFADMSLHVIDLILWFFGDDIKPKSVSAEVIFAVQHELVQYNDYDNTVRIVELWGGKIAYYCCCSRIISHGREDTTEIIGTEGNRSVNSNPPTNFVNYYHPGGITREIPARYYGGWILFKSLTSSLSRASITNLCQ